MRGGLAEWMNGGAEKQRSRRDEERSSGTRKQRRSKDSGTATQNFEEQAEAPTEKGEGDKKQTYV